jgi:hypothetical protein
MVAEETTRPQSPAILVGRVRSYGKSNRFATDRAPYSLFSLGILNATAAPRWLGQNIQCAPLPPPRCQIASP